jgi:hypothetical protein
MNRTILNLWLLLSLTIALGGCNKKTEINTGTLFFDDSQNTLWRHKVNSIEDLQKYSKTFKGLEFDVVYYPERDEFEVEHDPDPNSNIKLIDYFGSIPHPEKNFFWIDIKNLREEHIEAQLNRLELILKKYNIKENVICESWQINELKKLNDAGFYTSYWIPNFPYNGNINEEQQQKLDEIIEILSNCKHNAISAPYNMLTFINDYLPDCTVHLWTNGLIGESKKQQIKEIANHKIVKIVLIDYEVPF